MEGLHRQMSTSINVYKRKLGLFGELSASVEKQGGNFLNYFSQQLIVDNLFGLTFLLQFMCSGLQTHSIFEKKVSKKTQGCFKVGFGKFSGNYVGVK